MASTSLVLHSEPRRPLWLLSPRLISSVLNYTQKKERPHSLACWICHILWLLICRLTDPSCLSLDAISSGKPCCFLEFGLGVPHTFLQMPCTILSEQSTCIRIACWLVCLLCMAPLPPPPTWRLGHRLAHCDILGACFIVRLWRRVNYLLSAYVG